MKIINKYINHIFHHFKIAKSLLIIGNGFDLYCHLDSKFTDFLRNEINETSIESLPKIKCHKTLKKSELLFLFKALNDSYDLKKINKKNPIYSDFGKYSLDIIKTYYIFYDDMCSHKNKKVPHYPRDKKEAYFRQSKLFQLLIYLYCKSIGEDVPTLTNTSEYYLTNIFIDLFNYKKHSTHLNFWLMYFEILLFIDLRNNNNIKLGMNWSDIEANISNFLVKYSDLVYRCLLDIIQLSVKDIDKNTFKSKYDYNNNVLGSDLYRLINRFSSNTNYMGGNENDLYFMVLSSCILIYSGIFNNGIKNFSESYYYSYLLKQLELLETNFSKYLYNDLNKASYYRQNVNNLVKKLLPNDNNFNLLTFNYTLPNKEFFTNTNKKLIVQKNIHSTLEEYGGHPIFGINDGKCLQKDRFQPYIIFSKTFRIMRLAKVIKNNKLLNSHINQLIFFGQSFSVADYPYFQSIFDRYSIYNSNMNLIFCYAVFDNKHNLLGTKRDMELKHYNLAYYKQFKNKCAASLYKKVSNLLRQYSKSLNNKYHGRNLWTTLLLEDRLILHCINDKWY